MKKFKRVIAITMVLMMAVVFVPTSAFGVTEQTEGEQATKASEQPAEGTETGEETEISESNDKEVESEASTEETVSPKMATTQATPSKYNDGGGQGTAADPWLISNLTQLIDLENAVNGNSPYSYKGNNMSGKYFKLTADIGSSSNGFTTPIGYYEYSSVSPSNYPFSGHFDGGGHTVWLNINFGSSYGGLFGFVVNGTIQNITTAGTVKTSNNGKRFGGVCGDARNSTINNCHNKASVTGDENVGGVCGYSSDTTILNCSNSGAVTSSTTGTVLHNCGGVCGLQTGKDSKILKCYNAGTVTGGYGTGGICGQNSGGTITNCYNRGSVSGNTCGQVCASNSGTIYYCYYSSGSAVGSGSGSATNCSTFSNANDLLTKLNSYITDNSGTTQGWNSWKIKSDLNNGYPINYGNIVTLNLDGGSFAETLTDWTYDSNAKTYSRFVEGNTLTDPGTPTKEGCTFNGWKNGTADWDFSTSTLTGDTTLTADWKEITNVTVLATGGTEHTYDDNAKKITAKSVPFVKLAVDYYKVGNDGKVGDKVTAPKEIGNYLYVINLDASAANDYVIGGAIPADAIAGATAEGLDETYSNVGIMTIKSSGPATQPALTFGQSVYNCTYGDGTITPDISGGADDATITYSIASSTVEGCATIDNSGKITIIKPGTVVVKATAKKNGFEPTSAQCTVVIGKKPVDVKVKSQNVTYGSANPYDALADLEFSYDNAKTGLTPTFTTKYAAGNAVGEYSVKVSLPSSDLYSWNYEQGTLTVTPKELALSNFNITVANKYYDGNKTADVTATVSSGLYSGDTLKVAAEGKFVDADASTNNKNVTCTITDISGAKAGNYVLASSMTKTLTAKINKMPITFTFGTSEFGYDSSKKPVSVTAVDNNKMLFSDYKVYYKDAAGSESETAPTNAGTYTVTAKLNDADNYSTTLNTTTLTINQADAAVWASAGTDNLFDGTAKKITAMSLPSLELDVTYYSIDSTDTVGSSTTPTTNVGKYLYVISLKNTDKNKNYKINDALSGSPAGKKTTALTGSNFGIMTISKNAQTPLTVEQSVYNKTYGDEAFKPAVSGGNGTITYRNVNDSEKDIAVIGKDSGLITIKKPGTAIFEAKSSASGYADTTVRFTVIVQKQPITVSVADKSIEYSSATPYELKDLTFSPSIDTKDMTANFSTSYEAGKSVGEYSVRVNVGDSDYYSYSYEPGTLTVNPKTLKLGDFTVTAAGKEYDGTKAADVTATIKSGLFSGDAVTAKAEGAFESEAVGTGKTVNYEITGLSGAKAGNYALDSSMTGTTTANITKKPLTFTFGTSEFIYDGSKKDVTVTAVDSKKNIFTDYTVKYTGTNSTTYSESTTAPINVGTYKVSVTYDTNNYSSNTSESTLTIKKANAVVWASAGTEHKHTDTNKTITAMSAPKLSLVVEYYKIKADGTIGAKVDNPSDLGEYMYVIKLAASEKNYAIGGAVGTWTEGESKPSDLTGSNFGIMTIASDVQPALTVDKSIVNLTYAKELKYTQTVSGGASGAKVTYSIPNAAEKAFAEINSTTGELTVKKPGTVVVQATSKATGYADATVKYTVVIGKQKINVKVKDQTITYGSASPYDALADLTFPTGFGTTGLTATFETSYKQGSNANNYAVKAKIEETEYYIFDCESGTLTVEPKVLNVDTDPTESDFEVTAVDKEYDRNNYAEVTATVKSTSLINNDNLNVTADGRFVDATAGEGKTVNYKITGITGSKARNYELGTVEGTTTADITKMPVTFTMGETQFSYDGKPKPVTVTAVDRKGEKFTGFKVEYEGVEGTTYEKSTDAPSECGKYSISVSLTDDNYKIANSADITNKTLEIGSMQLTFTFGTHEFTYDGTAKNVEVSATDANKNVFKDFEVKYKGAPGTTYEESETAPTNVGTYTVTAEYDQAKYGSATNTTTLEIKPADVVVWANGGTEHAFEDVKKTINAKSTPALDLDVTYYSITDDKKVGSVVAPNDVGEYLYVITLANNDANKNYTIGGALTDGITGTEVNELTGSNFGIMTIANDIQPALTVEQDVYNKTYGDAAFTPSVTGGAGTITYSNVNESEKSIAEINADSGEITIKKPGTAVFEAKSEAEGYVDATVRYTVVIAKMPIDVKVKDQRRTYGDANPYDALNDLEFTEGFTTEDTPTFKTLYSEGDKVGRYDVSVTLPNSELYSYNYTSGTLTVNQKTLNVGDFEVAAADKVYDGTNAAKLTASVKSDALVENDKLNVTVEGAFTDATAAEEKTANFKITGISGTRAENYVLGSPMTGTTTAEISQMPITFQVGKTSFIYDGDSKPVTVTAEDANGKNFTSFTVKYKGTNYAESTDAPFAVGTYDIIITLNDTTNYKVSEESDDITGKKLSITKSDIVFTFGPSEFTYDGSKKTVAVSAIDPDNRVFTDYKVYYVGIDGTSYAKSETAPTKVGKYKVTAEFTSGKYSCAEGNNTTTMTIKPGKVVVWANSGTQHLYTDTDKTIKAMSVPDLNLDVTYYTISDKGIVGDEITKPNDRGRYLYVITLKNDDANKNYVIEDALKDSPKDRIANNIKASNVGIMTIDDSVQPELTVNDYVITKTYGDGKFTPRVSGGAPGAKITYSIPNVVERTYASVNEITGEITIRKPGIVVVEATASAKNYEDISVRYTVVINKKVVDIELGDSIQYTGKTEVTPYKVTGAVTGNPVKTSDIKFAYQKLDDTDVHTFRDAGRYHVTAEIPSSNEYYCTNGATSGIVEITKAPLTLTAEDKTVTYGDEPPTYTFKATGLLSNDKVASLGGTAKYKCDYKQFSDAGEYTIKLSGVTSNNYDITFADGELTVNPLPVVLNWANTAFTYDGKEHSVTATVANAVNGDKVKINSYTGDKATVVGDYTAEATGVDDNNYTLTGGSNLNQTWSIGEKPVTVKPAKVQVNVNEKAELKLDVTELLEGDREFTGNPDFAITKADGSEIKLADALKTSGTYTITWSNPGSINFNRNYSVNKDATGQLIVTAPKTPVEVVKAATSGSKKVKLSWLKVSGATKYVVYGQQCSKKYKKITTTSSNAYTVKKIGGKKLKAHKHYKFYVVAYTAKGQVTSKDIHFITGKTSGKYANAKSISVNTTALTLDKGKTATLKATTKIYKNKKHIKKNHGAATRYISDNPTVATVNANGVVTAKMGGTATIYVQDVGGLWCTTTVNVPYN